MNCFISIVTWELINILYNKWGYAPCVYIYLVGFHLRIIFSIDA